jgi:hypothetical protein
MLPTAATAGVRKCEFQRRAWQARGCWPSGRHILLLPSLNWTGRNKTNRLLGGFENLLLLAILRLDDRAYGVAIRQELFDRAGKDVAVGAIYTSLDRLEHKGLVQS